MRGVTKLMLMILICILNLHLQWRTGLNQHEDLSSQMPGNNYHRNDQDIIKFNNKGKWFFKNKLSQHLQSSITAPYSWSPEGISPSESPRSPEIYRKKRIRLKSFYNINAILTWACSPDIEWSYLWNLYISSHQTFRILSL